MFLLVDVFTKEQRLILDKIFQRLKTNLYAAMIISIADIYDALSSDRPYRTAFSSEETLSSLEKLIGIHFDEKIFKAFKQWIELSHKSQKK